MNEQQFTNAFLEAKLMALQEMVALASVRRCMCCGWPLAGAEAHGCVQGNCAYRPGHTAPEYEGWRSRMTLLKEANAALPGLR